MKNKIIELIKEMAFDDGNRYGVIVNAQKLADKIQDMEFPLTLQEVKNKKIIVQCSRCGQIFIERNGNEWFGKNLVLGGIFKCKCVEQEITKAVRHEH
jgi:hypothetical protein